MQRFSLFGFPVGSMSPLGHSGELIRRRKKKHPSGVLNAADAILPAATAAPLDLKIERRRAQDEELSAFSIRSRSTSAASTAFRPVSFSRSPLAARIIVYIGDAALRESVAMQKVSFAEASQQPSAADKNGLFF